MTGSGRLSRIWDLAAALVINALTFGFARCGNALPQDGHVRLYALGLGVSLPILLA